MVRHWPIFALPESISKSEGEIRFSSVKWGNSRGLHPSGCPSKCERPCLPGLWCTARVRIEKESHCCRAQSERIMATPPNLLRGAVSVLSLSCAAAYADTPPLIGSPLELVRFNDLNLDQPRDVARLLNRVGSAADKVCGTRSFASHYNKMADYEICYRETVARAVAH